MAAAAAALAAAQTGSVTDDGPVAMDAETRGQRCGKERWLLRMTWRAVMLHPRVNAVFMLLCIAWYMVFYYPLIEMLPFYTALLGARAANRLSQIWALVYGILGAVTIIILGYIGDRIGLRRLIVMSGTLTLAFVALLLQRSFAAQVAAQVVMVCVINIFFLLSVQFALKYGPPETFGTYSGAQSTIMGVAQVVITRLVSVVALALRFSPGVAQYDAIFVFFLAWTVACFVVLFRLWQHRAIPAQASITVADLMGRRESSRTLNN